MKLLKGFIFTCAIPWSEDEGGSLQTTRNCPDHLLFPNLAKPSYGRGGGMGARIVNGINNNFKNPWGRSPQEEFAWSGMPIILAPRFTMPITTRRVRIHTILGPLTRGPLKDKIGAVFVTSGRVFFYRGSRQLCSHMIPRNDDHGIGDKWEEMILRPAFGLRRLQVKDLLKEILWTDFFTESEGWEKELVNGCSRLSWSLFLDSLFQWIGAASPRNLLTVSAF